MRLSFIQHEQSSACKGVTYWVYCLSMSGGLNVQCIMGCLVMLQLVIAISLSQKSPQMRLSIAYSSCCVLGLHL